MGLVKVGFVSVEPFLLIISFSFETVYFLGEQMGRTTRAKGYNYATKSSFQSN
jgi:hypothetical protein